MPTLKRFLTSEKCQLLAVIGDNGRCRVEEQLAIVRREQPAERRRMDAILDIVMRFGIEAVKGTTWCKPLREGIFEFRISAKLLRIFWFYGDSQAYGPARTAIIVLVEAGSPDKVTQKRVIAEVVKVRKQYLQAPFPLIEE
jgi:hypothetical protein